VCQSSSERTCLGYLDLTRACLSQLYTRQAAFLSPAFWGHVEWEMKSQSTEPSYGTPNSPARVSIFSASPVWLHCL